VQCIELLRNNPQPNPQHYVIKRALHVFIIIGQPAYTTPFTTKPPNHQTTHKLPYSESSIAWAKREGFSWLKLKLKIMPKG